MFDNNTTKNIVDNVYQNGMYDVLKFTILFIVYKIFDILYTKKKWGGWSVEVYDDLSANPLARRTLSTISAKRVLTDVGDLSTFLKGVVSPFEYLNIDIVSEESKKIKLLDIDEKNKKMIIDISKNPKPKDK